MMNCEEARQSLFAYADGELAGQAAALVAEHVKLCGECRQTVDEQRGLCTALRRGLDAVPVPPGLEDRVRRAIAAGRPIRRARSRTLLLRIGALAAAACIVVVVTITWRYATAGRQDDPVVAAIVAKHRHCCGRGEDHHHADLPKGLPGLATAMTAHEKNLTLKIAAIAPDLSQFGFEFESANFCGLKDLECPNGAHVVYATKRADRHPARFSVFCVPLANQLVPLESAAGSPDIIRPISVPPSKAGDALCISVWHNDTTHYVCCGEVSPPELVDMAAAVRTALADPQTEATFAWLAHGP